MLRLSISFLGLILLPWMHELHAQPAPSEDHLAGYYRQLLDAPFYGDRMDGIVGLAHMRKASSGAVPTLMEKVRSGSESPFYRLLVFWSLARIQTPEAAKIVNERIAREIRKGPSGDFPVVAAKAAFLAAGEVSTRTLDRYLPPLYNNARSGETSEKILAAWALLEIGTAVTRETAARALKSASEELDPGNARYTRHLRYLRLLGSQTGAEAAAVISKLEEILANHEFRLLLVSKKALTVQTLAVLSYPNVPEPVNRYRQEVREKLDHPIFNSSGLRDALALGPFACTGPIVNALTEIAKDRDEEEDEREEARRALQICRN